MLVCNQYLFCCSFTKNFLKTGFFIQICSILKNYFLRAQGLASPLRPRSAYHLAGELPSASRPCRSAFSLLLILTPMPKKARISASFLLVGVTELASPLRPRSAFRLTGVLPSASRPCRTLSPVFSPLLR